MNTLKIIFFGTPDFVTPILQTLIDNFDVVGAVSAPDSIQGRKKELTPSPVKKFAVENGIKVFESLDISHWSLDIGQIGLFVVAAYGKIIPQSLLDLPKFGALNIHPSLLPKYRGPSPIQSAILNGETKSGISIIKMDERMDHGPIVAQWKYPLSQEDTFESLHQSMFKNAAEKLPGIIQDFIDGKITPEVQDEKKVTFCQMITKNSGYFDSNNPPAPEILDRMTRALYPWPTAWTKVRIKNDEERIMKLLPEEMVQIEGGRPMSIKDAINGYPELREKLEQLLLKE